jgi:hypothetical protein
MFFNQIENVFSYSMNEQMFVQDLLFQVGVLYTPHSNSNKVERLEGDVGLFTNWCSKTLINFNSFTYYIELLSLILLEIRI